MKSVLFIFLLSILSACVQELEPIPVDLEEEIEGQAQTSPNAPAPQPNPLPQNDFIAPEIISFTTTAANFPHLQASISLRLETNEKASCRFDDKTLVYGSLSKSLSSTTDGKTHIGSFPVKAEATEKTYTLFALCKDDAGNETKQYKTLSFNLEAIPTAKDTTRPEILSFSPTQEVTSSSTSISITTSESSVCKTSNSNSATYISMDSMQPSNGKKTHSYQVNNLNAGTSYTYYFLCKDDVGNDSLKKSYNFKTAAPAPALSLLSPAPLEVKVGMIKSTMTVASNVSGQLSYELIGEPDFITASQSGTNYTITAKPTTAAHIGNYSFQVKANDDSEVIFKTISLKVLEEDIPALTLSRTSILANVQVSKGFSTSVTAQNISGSLKFELVGAPSFVTGSKTGNTYNMAMMPKSNIDAKDYSFDIKVSDDDDIEIVKVTLKVIAAEGENYIGSKYLNSVSDLTNPANRGYLFLVNKNINLNGQTVTVQDGIGLQGYGGLLTNGTLKGNYILATRSKSAIFHSDMKLIPAYKAGPFFPEWYSSQNQSLNYAVNNASDIHLTKDKEYKSDSVTLSRSEEVEIHGNNAKLKHSVAHGGTMITTTSAQSSLKVTNLNFDLFGSDRCKAIESAGKLIIDNVNIIGMYCGSTSNSNPVGIAIHSKGTEVSIKNSSFKNFKDDRFSVTAIKIELPASTKKYNVTIENNEIESIESTESNAIAIHVRNQNSSNDGIVQISKNKIKGIYTISTKALYGQGIGAVGIYLSTSVARVSPTTKLRYSISENETREIITSALKIDVSYVKVLNNKFYSLTREFVSKASPDDGLRHKFIVIGRSYPVGSRVRSINFSNNAINQGAELNDTVYSDERITFNFVDGLVIQKNSFRNSVVSFVGIRSSKLRSTDDYLDQLEFVNVENQDGPFMLMDNEFYLKTGFGVGVDPSTFFTSTQNLGELSQFLNLQNFFGCKIENNKVEDRYFRSIVQLGGRYWQVSSSSFFNLMKDTNCSTTNNYLNGQREN